jgi:Tetratricopeptide repeat
MTRPSYKRTFMDRHGPEGAVRMKAAFFGAIVFMFGLLMFGALASQQLHLDGFPFILVTLGGACTLAGAAMYLGMMTGKAAGDVAQYVTAGGSSTPYEEQFSQEQALVMQRDYAAALNLFEQRIAQSPGEPRVRIAAADLYMTFGQNPKRAAELYREVQRIPELTIGHDVYVSNKLADLFLGPLAEPGRALVEFRRLIERYPGSTAATHARTALANVKKGMLKDAQAQPG